MKQTFALLLAMFFTALQAQTREYVHAFTDKDCYLTGEQALVHVVVTDSKLQPMDMSHVAYVELCDTEQMHAQCMVWLKNGEGWARLNLPGSMHSGNYQMNVYTRYLRNFGAETYCRRILSVVNLLHPSDKDDVNFVNESIEDATKGKADLSLPKTEYGTRELVEFDLPDVEGTCLTLSVFRKDILTAPSSLISNKSSHITNSDSFIPELEGHIVTAKPIDGKRVANSRLALVGKRGMVFDGKIQDDGSVRFFTQELYGSLPMTINGYSADDSPVPMPFVSPFEMVLPDSLPLLEVYYDEETLRDRSIAAQVEKSKRDVEIETAIHVKTFMGVEPRFFYDLDEWTKFKTVREILVEFVAGVRVRSLNKHKQLYAYEPGTKNYSNWPALVLLDGMPVYDIEALMDYDARRLKYVQIYNGRYQFGENICTGVISFISRKGAMQDFVLDEGTQMFTYDFPQNRPHLLSPDYSSVVSQLSPFYPDFRTTLYFNPTITSHSPVHFYTSDLLGTYEITLKYIDKNGQEQRLTSEFRVK